MDRLAREGSGVLVKFHSPPFFLALATFKEISDLLQPFRLGSEVVSCLLVTHLGLPYSGGPLGCGVCAARRLARQMT